MALDDPRADDLSTAFNMNIMRKQWRATKGGTVTSPTVVFNSYGSMVRITYHVNAMCFTVSFTRSVCAFGDFLSSAFRDLNAIQAALKASGFPFFEALDTAAMLRLEYDPRSKVATVFIANHGDDWQTAQPTPFKVPEENGKIDLDLT
jgi:hypothetical protein